jgi:hypothetical protein
MSAESSGVAMIVAPVTIDTPRLVAAPMARCLASCL